MPDKPGEKLKPPEEDHLIRCPRLGHQVGFSYCREENQGIPCFKTLDCWHMHFPVEDYLRRELSPAEWEQAFSRPKTTKLSSLLELIQAARDRTPGSE